MQGLRKSLYAAAAVAAGLLSTTIGVHAQEWPSAKPVTLIMPFAAGADYLARVTAAALETRLGQKMIVENRVGAGGATGTAYAARQAPDGYTLIFALPGPSANYTNTVPSLPYKPLEDFDHISQVATADMAIIARKDFPANNLQELIAYAKANPGKVSVGNQGVGSYGHMVALLLADTAGFQFKYVQYRGAAQIATDMMSGSLDLSSDYYGSAYVKHVEAGTLKVIGFPAAQRTKILPDVHTFKEDGIDIVTAPWFGLMAPKGTPRPIIDKINAALKDFLNSEEARTKLGSVGQVPSPTTPEAFHDIVVKEEAMWRGIIQKHNIRNE